MYGWTDDLLVGDDPGTTSTPEPKAFAGTDFETGRLAIPPIPQRARDGWGTLSVGVGGVLKNRKGGPPATFASFSAETGPASSPPSGALDPLAQALSRQDRPEVHGFTRKSGQKASVFLWFF